MPDTTHTDTQPPPGPTRPALPVTDEPMSGMPPLPLVTITCLQCQATNPPEHRFCRSCGGSLWKACSNCGKPRPVDESFCALCGENLADVERRLVDQHRARLAEIEDMIEAQCYRDATLALHALMGGEKHPCLTEIRQLATRRLAEVTAAHAASRQRCAEHFACAQQLVDDRQYAAAAQLLEAIPAGLRDDPINRLLAEAGARAEEIVTFKRQVQASSGVTFQDRMLGLARLLVLLPDDPQIVRWAVQARDQVLDIARQKLLQHQYRVAVELLESIPQPVVNDAVSGLLRRAAELDYLASELELAPVITELTLRLGQRLVKLDPENQPARGRLQELARRFQTAQAGGVPASVPGAACPAQTHVGIPVHAYAMPRAVTCENVEVANRLHEQPGRFAVACGLALQAINRAQITTNLLPARNTGVLGLFRVSLGERPPTSGWGVDVSVSGLKAVRIALVEDRPRITHAVHIPHRLPLTHPEAVPIRKALVVESLTRFLPEQQAASADRLGISWPAVQSFVRFLRLPATGGRRQREMLQLEARQQIPMPLELVAWDMFTFPALSYVSQLEPLYSLLVAARLREVEEYLAHFREAGIRVDLLQCDAAALHNYFYFDAFRDLPEEAPDVKPPGILVADVGAEITNLLFSFRHGLWFRSVRPAGDDIVAGLIQRFKLTREVAAQVAIQPTKAARVSEVYKESSVVFQKLVAQIEGCTSEFTKTIALGAVREMLVVGGAGNTPGLVRYLRYGR